MCDKEERESSSEEDKKWTWNNTELENEKHTILTVNDIKQLLMNRGENKCDLKRPKMELITKLKKKYNVELHQALSDLTGKQLLGELKLRCLNHKSAKKDILIRRLNSAQPTIRQKQLNESPESFAKAIPWQHTEFKELDIHYLEQLLMNRGVSENDMNENRADLIKLLKEKHSVKFQQPFRYLSRLAIKAEFALYGINNFRSSALKAALIKQLKATIKHHTNCRQWICLSHEGCYEYSSQHICAPMMINNNEFLMATERHLIIYSTINNYWTYLMTYRDDRNYYRAFHDTHKACLDVANTLIYIYDRHQERQQLFIINYETKTTIKVIMMQNVSNVIGNNVKLMFAHKQLHLIGGYSTANNKRHLIFDEEKETFNVCYTFKGVHISDFCIACKQRMLLICGDGNGYFEYNMSTHEWTKFEMKMACLNVLGGICGCAVTRNQQYAILLGSANICILDLNDMQLYQSGVIQVAQSADSYESIVVHSKNDTVKEELIAFGYIRHCFHSQAIGQSIFPPHYIIKMIQEYCSDEFLHVFERRPWRGCKHRKISINALTNNMTPVLLNDSNT